ncbi:MAG: IS3 family transposase, partial [Actinobacteria bacterium]|nr:IS3 family transposase [Actinomycetota bacterium]
MASRPDPEVRPTRQSYPVAYKLRILAELDAADSKTARGEIMRREGLYSSLISAWRDQRDQGALAAMKARKPGPKGDP